MTIPPTAGGGGHRSAVGFAALHASITTAAPGTAPNSNVKHGKSYTKHGNVCH